MITLACTDSMPEVKRGGRPRKYPSTPLRDWALEVYGESRLADLASALKISARYLEDLMAGHATPSVTLAKRIKRITGGHLDLDAILDYDGKAA